jgi:hypothetical protein
MQNSYILVTQTSASEATYESGRKARHIIGFSDFFNIVRKSAELLSIKIVDFDEGMVLLVGNWEDEANIENSLKDRLSIFFNIFSLSHDAYQAMMNFQSGNKHAGNQIEEISTACSDSTSIGLAPLILILAKR